MMTTSGPRHALVCGATKGIGKACAIALAELGMRISLCARREEALEHTRTELQGSGHNILIADLDNVASFHDLAEKHCQRFGAFDVIVNNSGGPQGGPMQEADAAEFTRALNRLILAAHGVIRQNAEHMKAQRFGRIINVISTSVRQPIDNLGVSNTIRAATAAWSKTWSRELAPFGITVNSVLPGATRTQRLESIIQRTAERTGRSVLDVEQEMLKEIPAGRFAEAHEVAAAVAFLASEQASYITGIHLSVDGGRTRSLL